MFVSYILFQIYGKKNVEKTKECVIIKKESC